MDASSGKDSYQSDMTIRRDTPIQTDKSCDRGRDVGEPQHSRSDKKSPGKNRGELEIMTKRIVAFCDQCCTCGKQ